MSLEHHLVLFTRYPSFGAGKRRLAAGGGEVLALRFQRINLANTVRRLAPDRRWRMWLAVTPDRSGPWRTKLGIVRQGKGDLGQRLMRVARSLPTGPVLIVGSDVPGITTELIARGFQMLEGHDAVVGPSTDGGYWAVGLRRRPHIADPFWKVRWSSPHALADTIANLDNYRVGMLDELDDVDDVAALGKVPKWDRLVGRTRS